MVKSALASERFVSKAWAYDNEFLQRNLAEVWFRMCGLESLGGSKLGVCKDVKKAYVTLEEGNTIGVCAGL